VVEDIQKLHEIEAALAHFGLNETLRKFRSECIDLGIASRDSILSAVREQVICEFYGFYLFHRKYIPYLKDPEIFEAFTERVRGFLEMYAGPVRGPDLSSLTGISRLLHTEEDAAELAKFYKNTVINDRTLFKAVEGCPAFLASVAFSGEPNVKMAAYYCSYVKIDLDDGTWIELKWDSALLGGWKFEATISKKAICKWNVSNGFGYELPSELRELGLEQGFETFFDAIARSPSFQKRYKR
jgi:hypothetical protein